MTGERPELVSIGDEITTSRHNAISVGVACMEHILGKVGGDLMPDDCPVLTNPEVDYLDCPRYVDAIKRINSAENELEQLASLEN